MSGGRTPQQRGYHMYDFRARCTLPLHPRQPGTPAHHDVSHKYDRAVQRLRLIVRVRPPVALLCRGGRRGAVVLGKVAVGSQGCTACRRSRRTGTCTVQQQDVVATTQICCGSHGTSRASTATCQVHGKDST